MQNYSIMSGCFYWTVGSKFLFYREWINTWDWNYGMQSKQEFLLFYTYWVKYANHFFSCDVIFFFISNFVFISTVLLHEFTTHLKHAITLCQPLSWSGNNVCNYGFGISMSHNGINKVKSLAVSSHVMSCTHVFPAVYELKTSIVYCYKYDYIN